MDSTSTCSVDSQYYMRTGSSALSTLVFSLDLAMGGGDSDGGGGVHEGRQ